MEKFDPSKITLKEYIDACMKICKKSASDAASDFEEKVKETFEKLEEMEQNRSPYEAVRQDLFNMCTDRKVTFGGCKGCNLRLGDKYCLEWFFEEMLSEIEEWKNEQNAGN